MNNSKSKTIIHGQTRNEIFFLSVLFAYLFFSAIDNYTLLGENYLVAKICDIAKIVIFIALAVKAAFSFKTYNIKQIVAYALFGSLGVICFFVNRTIGPIVFLLFWVNIKEVNFKDILWVYLCSVGLIVFVTFMCVVLNVIPDILFDGSRHAFGFSHANTLGAITMALIMCYAAYRFDKIKWYETALCSTLALMVFILSRSKGAFACTLITLILCLILKSDLSPLMEKLMTVLSACIYPMCTVTVFAVSYLYKPDNKFFLMINHLLTGRPGLGNKAISNYGIKLLGQKIEWIAEGDKYNIVDSSYLFIVFDYGVIFLAVFIAMYALLGFKAGKNRKWDLVLVLITVALHAIVEGTLINVVCNPAVIAIGYIFFEDVWKRSDERQ